MSKIRIAMEPRLRELARRLQEKGLKFPESSRVPGAPHVSEITRLVSGNESTFGLKGGAPTAARKLLDQLVDEVGLMDLGSFRAAVKGDPEIVVARCILDESMVALMSWIERTRDAKLAVPESKLVKGEPYFALIGRAAGVDQARLAHAKMPYRAIIEDFVAEVGLMQAEEYSRAAGVRAPKSVSQKAQLLRAARLKEFLTSTHVAPFASLPESSHKRGTPHYGKVCKNAGLHFRGLALDAEIVKVVDEAAQIVGIGADRFKPAIHVKEMTYARFMEHCLVRLSLEEPSASKSKIERFKSALRKWQRATAKSDDDRLGEDFGGEYQRVLGAVAATFTNEDTRRHWLSDMSRWYGYFSTFQSTLEPELPYDFSGALLALIRRDRYRSLAEMLRAAGLYQHLGTIRPWVKGQIEPVRSDRTLVHKLENFFQVEFGTLTQRIRTEYHPAVGDMRIEYWPRSLDTDALRVLAKPLLPPEWVHMSEGSREAIGASIRSEAQSSIPYRIKQRATRTRRLHPIPKRIKDEWQELVEYKTSLFPDYPRSSMWAEGTVDRNWNEFHSFFDALSTPRIDGGLGVPPEALTFALLACPKVVRWYVEWKMDRSEEGLNTGARTWLGLFGHLGTLETRDQHRTKTTVKGFLHYVPQWADRLSPVEGVLNQSGIADLRTAAGWERGLTSTSDMAYKIFKDQRGLLTLSRDPFAPIMPVLDSGRPMDALIHMLQAAYEALPDPRIVSAYRRAIAVRRFVIVLIAVRTALRRKNLAQLTWSTDNLGKMKRLSTGWRIEIPSKEFKNWRSPFFGTQGSGNRERTSYVYTFDVRDTAILDEYVNVSRSVLSEKAKAPTDCFFLSRHGNPINPDQITYELHLMTWVHLVYHETTGTGIKGVESFGVHAIRDIVATHILKTQGSVDLAADAIQDTPAMVWQHYARFLASDRTKRVADFLHADLPEANWGASAAA